MKLHLYDEDDKKCFICGRNGNGDRLEHHHVFGAALRPKSEKYGLVVLLCGEGCHRTGKNSVHVNAKINRILQRKVQLKAMTFYGWSEDEFREIFGKSYLRKDC